MLFTRKRATKFWIILLRTTGTGVRVYRDLRTGVDMYADLDEARRAFDALVANLPDNASVISLVRCDTITRQYEVPND